MDPLMNGPNPREAVSIRLYSRVDTGGLFVLDVGPPREIMDQAIPSISRVLDAVKTCDKKFPVIYLAVTH